MSNFLAIATVTATLKTILLNTLTADHLVNTETHVTTVRPDSLGGDTLKAGVNIYLYQVTPNLARRNHDLPTRRADGALAQQPQLALDLHYLLSFYGDETTLTPQQLFGATVRTLHVQPVLTRQNIFDAIKSSEQHLQGSNLADQVDLVRLTPLSLSLEELSKIWSVFFQTKYTLSVAYQASVVLIEGDSTPRPALPVRQRTLYIGAFRQPVIEQITATLGLDEPIVATSSLRISGAQLRGDSTLVRFGPIDVTPPLNQVSDRQIEVTLPTGLRAGVQGVQIVQPILLGAPPTPHDGAESNIVPFVLRPSITAVVSNVQKLGNNMSACSADVTVTFTPQIAIGQRVALLLNELQTTPSTTARAYRFAAPTADASKLLPGVNETNTIVFPVRNVMPGAYLVRVQVDGAESALVLAPAGHYEGPLVQISPPEGGSTGGGAPGGGSPHFLRADKIDVKPTRQGDQVTFNGEVTVKDEDGSAVPGTVVTATWTLYDGTSVKQTATTNSRGVTPKSNAGGFSISQPAGDGKREVTLTVTDITKAGDYTFDPDGSKVLSKKAHA